MNTEQRMVTNTNPALIHLHGRMAAGRAQTHAHQVQLADQHAPCGRQRLTRRPGRPVHHISCPRERFVEQVMCAVVDDSWSEFG